MTLGIRAIEEKVFHISTESGSGTAFTYRRNGEEYLVTAKQVVENLGKNGIIYINRMTDRIEKKVEIHCSKFQGVDIAVLKYDGYILDNPMDLNYEVSGIDITQDVYFFGYPFNYCSLTDAQLKENCYRIPMVKKGIISGTQATKESCVLFIDAHSNQGFSGGPVVVFKDRKPTVCGVVRGYLHYEGGIYKKGTDTIIDEITYRENSGIMLAYGINHATDKL